MLIRRNSGKSGIKEYLENGQKHDRYFSRDELDERVILSGNLEIVDKIINSMETTGDKYFHITLSFKEDYIDNDVLSKINNEFRAYYFKSFTDDEIHYYAEAHLPRLKSYTTIGDKNVYRKPHIHVVVPKINLLTNGAINYYGTLETNYIDAFQEYINCKYGLESPVDNPRYKINQNSEFISRYKGDGFIGKGKDFRGELLNTILKNNINSLVELDDYLKNIGHETKYRNNNKDEKLRYLNVINNGESINLRDHVFKDEFLKLELNKKLLFLENSQNNNKENKYYEQQSVRNIDEKYLKLMTIWDEYKALEGKYRCMLSKSKRFNYDNLTTENKAQFLNKMHNEFYIKHNIKLGDFSGEYRHNDGVVADNLRTANEYINATGENLRTADNLIARISGVKRSSVTDEHRRGVARRYTDIARQNSGGERGYGINNNSSQLSRENPNSSHLSQTEYANINKVSPNSAGSMVAVLNKEIKANILLELLEKTHGLNPELYRITVANDGSDRIGVGNRNLSMLDFCLKEMHLTYKTALPLLENALALQNSYHHEIAYNKDDIYLREQFIHWFKSYKIERAILLDNSQAELTGVKEDIKNKYKNLIQGVNLDRAIPYHKKIEMKSALRFQQNAELAQSNKIYYQNNAEIRNKHNLEMQNAYRVFLMRKAQQEHDEIALRELRRLRIEFTYTVESLSFSYTGRYNEFKLNMSYEIDKNGVVSYKDKDITVIRDYGSMVEVVKRQDEYIRLSFKLAQNKFGNKLSIRGKEVFRQKCVEYALNNGIDVEYLDDFCKAHYAKLLQELKVNQDLFNNDLAGLIRDKPDKLMVSGIYQAPILLNKKKQMVNFMAITDPDTKKSYKLHSYQINSFVKKVNVGDFVNFVYDKNANELKLKHVSDHIIRNKIKNEIGDKCKIDFENEIKNKHGVSSLLDSYSGILIKSGSNARGRWVLIKNKDNKFIKIENNELHQKLQGISYGNSIAVAVPKNITHTTIESKKQLDIVKINKSIDEYIIPHKDNEKTIIGHVTKQSSFKFSDGYDGYRVAIRDVLSGQIIPMFTNTKLDIDNGNLIKANLLSWNNYEVQQLNDVDKLMRNEFVINGRDIITGRLVKTSISMIRGKPVFTATMLTMDGFVSKHGETMRKLFTDRGIIIGDTVTVTNLAQDVSLGKDVPVIEVVNLTESMVKSVAKRINEIKSDITKI